MPAAVVGDRHPKNRGVDERLTPHHEPELRSLLEQFEQFKQSTLYPLFKASCLVPSKGIILPS